MKTQPAPFPVLWHYRVVYGIVTILATGQVPDISSLGNSVRAEVEARWGSYEGQLAFEPGWGVCSC